MNQIRLIGFILAALLFSSPAHASVFLDMSEGVWQGDGVEYDAEGKEARHYKIAVNNKRSEKDPKIVLINMDYTYADGGTKQHRLTLRSTGQGDFFVIDASPKDAAVQLPKSDGNCYKEGLCSNIRVLPNGAIFFCVNIKDGENQVRSSRTSMLNGKVVRTLRERFTRAEVPAASKQEQNKIR